MRRRGPRRARSGARQRRPWPPSAPPCPAGCSGSAPRERPLPLSRRAGLPWPRPWLRPAQPAHSPLGLRTQPCTRRGARGARRCAPRPESAACRLPPPRPPPHASPWPCAPGKPAPLPRRCRPRLCRGARGPPPRHPRRRHRARRAPPRQGWAAAESAGGLRTSAAALERGWVCWALLRPAPARTRRHPRPLALHCARLHCCRRCSARLRHWRHRSQPWPLAPPARHPRHAGRLPLAPPPAHAQRPRAWPRARRPRARSRHWQRPRRP
mmetsp:Transcript_852/g.2582  ORF Transcript_852/g.2582 Transcript_852/m.2582 type:complete len:268 (-) Transcript_852:524-1327(-)